MTPKVSVVVPVWNPGRFIDRCIDSLLAQTMATDEFEVLFMDDGSTDGTGRRLDELAAEHPHFLVHHLENSGWPGKPRNVGIERASGEYVQFMDNDDALGPEALERLYAIGARNNSDIVIGKVVSDFRGVPHVLFRTTRERCTVHDAPLFESLTPHKMFRRQFLLDNDIRYPEGKRRLEDQLIMARAYFPAKNVSIVGDYVCYYYLKREDGTNAGSTQIDPKGYYDNLREVLDVVEANTEPGEFRDSIQRRFYRGEMLSRVGSRAVLRYQPHFRDKLLGEIRRLTQDPRFAPGVHDGLLAFVRVRGYFVRANRIEDLLTYVERCQNIRAKARLEDMRWQDGTLVLTVRAWFTYGNEPLSLIGQGGRLYIPQEIALDAPADQRECTGEPETVLVDATIKNRTTSEEFFLPTGLQLQERPSTSAEGTTVRLEWVGEVRLDPTTAFGGRALQHGVWDISIKLSGLGLSRETRLGRSWTAADDGARPALLGERPLLAIPYWTEGYGNLSVDVDGYVKALRNVVRPAPVRLGPLRGFGPTSLEVSLPVALYPRRALTGTVRLIHRATMRVLDYPVESERDGDSVRFRIVLPSRQAGLTAGTWDVALILPAMGWQEPVRIGRVVRVPKVGPMRVRTAPELRLGLHRLSAREVFQLVRKVRRDALARMRNPNGKG